MDKFSFNSSLVEHGLVVDRFRYFSKEKLLLFKKQRQFAIIQKNIINKELKYFCTITLDYKKVNRFCNHHKLINLIFKDFNVSYIGVKELHKDGASHYHYITNRISKICLKKLFDSFGYTLIKKLEHKRHINYIMKYLQKQGVRLLSSRSKYKKVR